MSGKAFDVLAVGDVNIDLILGVRELPAFGQEILAHSLGQHLGGSTANFACYCARLGLRTAFVARVGEDDFGGFLLAELRRFGVITDHVRRDDGLPTGITVSLSGPSDRAFVTYVGTIDANVGEDAPDELLARARLVHVGSYFLQTKLQSGLPDLFRRAHQAGALTSLDTGYDPGETWGSGVRQALAEVDLFLPNEVEATALTGEADPVAAQAALRDLGPAVALKLGAAGACYLDRDRVAKREAFGVEVADTTCCGDAFNAAFVAAWLQGESPEDCLAWGNACGALVASAPGNAAESVSAEAVRSVITEGRVL